MAWQRPSVMAAAGLLCFLALLSEAQAQCGGFAASCKIDSFEFGAGGIFRAQCRNNAGKYVAASINPNPHISNVDGNLVDGVNFLRSCTPGGVASIGNSVSIIATCLRNSGAKSITYYDINRKVSNYNGKLVWNNCRRRALLESTGPALAGGRKVLSV